MRVEPFWMAAAGSFPRRRADQQILLRQQAAPLTNCLLAASEVSHVLRTTDQLRSASIFWSMCWSNKVDIDPSMGNRKDALPNVPDAARFQAGRRSRSDLSEDAGLQLLHG